MHVPMLQGVPRTQLQLVGVACMLIASKHEEVRSLQGLWAGWLWAAA